MKKGTYGYIKEKRKRSIVWSLIFLAIIVGLTLIGVAIFGSTKNVITIAVAVLTLPAARVWVSTFVILPFQGLEQESYKKIEGFCEKEKITPLYDMAISSTEKINFFPVLIVINESIYGISLSKTKVDFNKDKSRLNQLIKSTGLEGGVNLVTKAEELMEQLREVTNKQYGEQEAELVQRIVTLCV